jgi:hypothetical protein
MEQIENGIAELFGILVGGSFQAATAAINCVLSVRTRLLMIRAAASTRLKDTPLFDECIRLCDRLDDKAIKRNQLAHFMLFQDAVVNAPDEPITTEVLASFDEQIDWYLSPTYVDGARNWRFKEKIPQIRANDVKNRTRAFADAANELREFSKKVRAALEQPGV